MQLPHDEHSRGCSLDPVVGSVCSPLGRLQPYLCSSFAEEPVPSSPTETLAWTQVSRSGLVLSALSVIASPV